MKEITITETLEPIQISISVSLNDKFKPYKKGEPLYNFGHIEIESIYNDNTKTCFWDNLQFFLDSSKKEIYKECFDDLKDNDLYHEEVFKSIRRMIKLLIKHKYLNGK